MLLLSFNYDTKQSVVLSNVLIFVLSFVKYLFGLTLKHPKIPHKTLICYNTIIIWFPSIMIGSLLGSIIVVAVPDLVQLLLLLALSGNSGYKTFKLTIIRYKNETLVIQKAAEKKNQE